MTWDQLLANLGVPTGVVLALVAVVLIAQWIRGGGERRLRRRATQLLGDGQQPGLLATVEEQGRDIATIKAQLSPNSGGSLHDLMVRVDERTLRVDERLFHVERRLDDHITSPHPR
jgi:hypothetical protein